VNVGRRGRERPCTFLVVFLMASLVALYQISSSRALARPNANPSQQHLTRPILHVPLPKNVCFSNELDGLALGIHGPKSVPVHDLLATPFEVFIVNLKTKSHVIALSRHVFLLRLTIYSPEGKLLTDLSDYGPGVHWASGSMQELVVLGSGDMMRSLLIPISIDSAILRRGLYQVRAILMSPPDDWWPPEIRTLLRREGISIWGPAKLVSPAHRIKLE
jgi:hypothetical protein